MNNPEQTSKNIFMNTLKLVHIHRNIVDKIDLADVANKSVDKTINNICKIKLTLTYFSYIYICYQIYTTWSCVTFTIH